MNDKNKKLIIVSASILSILLIIYLLLLVFKNDEDVYVLKDEEMFYKIQATINDYIKKQDYVDPSFTLKKIYYKNEGILTYYYASGYILDYVINSYNIYELDKNQNESILENINSEDYNFENGNILSDISWSEQNKLSSYIAEFLNLLNIDNKEAYELLSDNTKNKYSSYDNFLTNSVDIYNMLDTTIKNYTKQENKDYTLYEIIDNKNNTIKIIEYSIMNYKIEY